MNENISPELKTALNDLQATLKTDTAAQINAAVAALEAKQKPGETSKEIEDLKTAVNVVKDEATKQKEAIDQIAKDFSKQHLNEQRLDKGSFGAELLKGLTVQKEALKEYKNTRRPVSVDLKAAADIGSGNFTNFPTTARFQLGDGTSLGNVNLPYASVHMRNIIPTAPVQGDNVTIIRDMGGVSAPAGVAPGGAKPQSDRSWQKVTIPVTKVAHWYRIPEEWLEDLAWLSNDISQIGTEELLKVEDAKIISNAIAGEFTGLVQNSTAYAAPASLALKVKTPNNYDVLVSSWTQARNLNEVPNYHVINPSDYAAMILAKDLNGNYPFGPNVNVPYIMGVPAAAITAMTPGKFFTMDTNLSTIGIRQGINVRFFDQDQDNAIKNMVTVVIEERIVLVVRRITSVIYGDFAAAITALTAP